MAEINVARRELKNTLRQLHQDKVGWEQVIKDPKPYQNDAAYADSARREIAAINQKIITVQAELALLLHEENSH